MIDLWRDGYKTRGRRNFMKPKLPKRWAWSYAFGGVLIAVSLVFAALMVVVSSSRELSPLESSLFQAVILGGSLSGSFLFGRISAAGAARDVIRPHARSAFRRIRSLRRSLHRLSDRIETMQEESPDHRLETVRAVIIEQASASQDALDDWRDVIPDDVADMADMDAAPDDIDDIDDSDEESGALDWRV